MHTYIPNESKQYVGLRRAPQWKPYRSVMGSIWMHRADAFAEGRVTCPTAVRAPTLGPRTVHTQRVEADRLPLAARHLQSRCGSTPPAGTSATGRTRARSGRRASCH